jgi:hypothetical protein
MAQTRERRQVVRAHQGVDRVNLQHTEALDLRLQLAVANGAARRTGEALGGQGQAAGFGEGQ